VSRIRIVTDSAAALDPGAVQKLGITVVPLTVRIGRETYQDRKELNAEHLLHRMADEHVRPQVVGPTAEDFRRVYGSLTRHTDQIISLHSSAGLSPVRDAAARAAEEFLGRCDIIVIDSETVSLGLGILVEEAARLSRNNIPLNEVVRHVRGVIRHLYVAFITQTLDYLEHSHLISPAQAIVGSMLDIEPFLLLEEGQLMPMEKVQTPERAVDKLAEFAGEFSRIERLAILQSTPNVTHRTQMLLDHLNAVAPGHKVPIFVYGPVIASKLGPDGLGLMVYDGPGNSWTF